MAIDNNLNLDYGVTLDKNSGIDKSIIPSNTLARDLIAPVLTDDQKNILNRSSNSSETVNPGKKDNPGSLFYNAGYYERPGEGKFNTFLFYSFKDANSGNDPYFKSENARYNGSISSKKSKNPSAGNLVGKTSDYNSGQADKSGGIIGGESAPYFWKDFLYCKYYGTIPNNRLITLRRFPHPMQDNLSVPSSVLKSSTPGPGRPVAQAVTWFGGNTGNTLNGIVSFGTGINWQEKIQTGDVQEVKTLDSGLFGAATGIFSSFPLIKSLLKGVGEFNEDVRNSGFANGTDQVINYIAALTGQGMSSIEASTVAAIVHNDKWTKDNGPLQDFIFAPVNTINKTHIRALGLKWGDNPITIKFHYELTSVGEVNTKAAFFDILANLLSIGTNYGNWLIPPYLRDSAGFPALEIFGGNKGYYDFYQDPVKFFQDKLKFINGGTFDDLGDSVISKTDGALKGKTVDNLRSSIKNLTSGGGIFSEDAMKNTSTIATNILAISQGVEAPMSFLTGIPTGEWHLTVGNPYNPIAMIGNLICTDLKIDFGESLGPDDFPTEIVAEFTLKHARDRERADIESIFNRGQGRLYQSVVPTTSDSQTRGSRTTLYESANKFLEDKISEKNLNSIRINTSNAPAQTQTNTGQGS